MLPGVRPGCLSCAQGGISWVMAALIDSDLSTAKFVSDRSEWGIEPRLFNCPRKPPETTPMGSYRRRNVQDRTPVTATTGEKLPTFSSLAHDTKPLRYGFSRLQVACAHPELVEGPVARARPRGSRGVLPLDSLVFQSGADDNSPVPEYDHPTPGPSQETL